MGVGLSNCPEQSMKETLRVEPELIIRSGPIPPDDILRSLEDSSNPCRYGLELRQPRSEFRSLEPSVIVASIAAAGVVFKVLIDYLIQKQKQTITIKVADGQKMIQVLVPITVRDEDIDRVIKRVQHATSTHIELQ